MADIPVGSTPPWASIIAAIEDLEVQVKSVQVVDKTGFTSAPTASSIVAGSFGAGAITAAVIATGAIDADAIAADAIGASEFAQGAADKVWSSATRTLTGAVTVSTVRASSSQRATGTLGIGTTAVDISIASVTLTRASQASSCRGPDVSSETLITSQITAATGVNIVRSVATNSAMVGATETWELL